MRERREALNYLLGTRSNPENDRICSVSCRSVQIPANGSYRAYRAESGQARFGPNAAVKSGGTKYVLRVTGERLTR